MRCLGNISCFFSLKQPSCHCSCFRQRSDREFWKCAWGETIKVFLKKHIRNIHLKSTLLSIMWRQTFHITSNNCHFVCFQAYITFSIGIESNLCKGYRKCIIKYCSLHVTNCVFKDLNRKVTLYLYSFLAALPTYQLSQSVWWISRTF